MAADGRVVAEDLVLHDVLPRLHRAEEVGNVVRRVVVTLRQCEGLCLVQLRRRRRVHCFPFLHAEFCLRLRHSAPAIDLKTRRRVLGRKGQRAP